MLIKPDASIALEPGGDLKLSVGGRKLQMRTESGHATLELWRSALETARAAARKDDLNNPFKHDRPALSDYLLQSRG